MRTPDDEIEPRFIELRLNTRGSTRAKAERLFKAYIRMIGVAEVPWFSEVDDEEGNAVTEDEEMVMGHSDQEMAAAQDRGDRDEVSADDVAGSKPVPLTMPSVTNAHTSWPQKWECSRASTTTTYMYQIPPLSLTKRGLGVRLLDLAQIDRGCFFYYKKRLCKAFLTNGPSVKCYSYVKLEIFATFNY